jgi:hypothetical protein
LYLSVVDWPMDGADDAAKMGTRGLLGKCYYPNLRTRSQHHQSPNADLPASSVVGRVAGTTLLAVDEETVHLVVLGVQQDRPTVSAYIVNCVRASDENGRCMYYIFDAPGFYYSQCSLWIFHDRLFSSVRKHMRVYGKGPAPAKAERGNFQVEAFLFYGTLTARFHT